MLALGLEAKEISPFLNFQFQVEEDEDEGNSKASEAAAFKLARQYPQARPSLFESLCHCSPFVCIHWSLEDSILKFCYDGFTDFADDLPYCGEADSPCIVYL